MKRAWQGTTTDPPNGVLSGAVSGGKLALIQNDSLRTLLAGWSGRIEDRQKTEELVAQYAVQVLTPWLAEHDVLWPEGQSASRWYARAVVVVRDRTYRGHLFFLGRRGVTSFGNSR
jgi:hypothetical protein